MVRPTNIKNKKKRGKNTEKVTAAGKKKSHLSSVEKKGLAFG